VVLCDILGQMPEGRIISACSGTFDGWELHRGHEYFFTQVSDLGDESVVFINTDDVIRRNKLREPLYEQKVRARHVSELGIVSSVVLFEGDDEAQLRQIEDLSPEVYCFTEKNDYPFDEEIKRRLAPRGTVFVTIPTIQENVYSTSLRIGVLCQRMNAAMKTAMNLQRIGERGATDLLLTVANYYGSLLNSNIGGFNRALTP
jgi:glycerol-3-phosphate cytidylyltransferase-like family protein